MKLTKNQTSCSIVWTANQISELWFIPIPASYTPSVSTMGKFGNSELYTLIFKLFGIQITERIPPFYVYTVLYEPKIVSKFLTMP